MPKFTIETTYRLPVYRQRTYEADTFAEACALAVEDDDWDGAKEDFDTAGKTYITGIWEGEDSAHKGPGFPIPPKFATEETAPSVTPDDDPPDGRFVFTSSNGWTWEIEDNCVLVFDDESEPIMCLPQFIPTIEICRVIISAYERGRFVGEAIGEHNIKSALRRVLGI